MRVRAQYKWRPWVLALATVASAGTLYACGPDVAGNAAGLADNDKDGYTPAQGDCDDNNPARYPGGIEVADSIDNDCDGAIDNNLYSRDDDGDGFTDEQGDCNDFEPLVNPGAAEVQEIELEDGTLAAEGVDNDCDGEVDEAEDNCDAALSGDAAEDFAKSIGLCKWLVSSTWTKGMDFQRNIVPKFGASYVPWSGSSMIALSSGVASDVNASDYSNPREGYAVGTSVAHPTPVSDPAGSCNQADPTTVNDPVVLSLSLQVPTNARGFTFDFAFMTSEFSRFRCTRYDDTFVAYLDSEEFLGNISFDENGAPISVNAAFMKVCTTTIPVGDSDGSNSRPSCQGNAELLETGFENWGGTGRLRTTAPARPGETINLDFYIFDEGDGILDSTVLIDNFRWVADPVGNPITNPD